VSFRADGDLGVSLPFPLLIFKNVQVGLSGGWLVNRIYLKDKDLRNFGWMVHYTGSASRWVDGYVAAGWEYDVVDTDPGHTRARNLFVTENGIKLRVNIHHTPMKPRHFPGLLISSCGVTSPGQSLNRKGSPP